jgi:AraC-like DNA-binding protein
MWHASDAWKRDVQDAMADQKISRAELSRRVGVSDAAITQLFKADTEQSRLVPAINRVLGMPPPTQTSGEVDGDLAELIEIWKRLDEAARKVLLDMAGVAARSKR